MLGCEHVLQVLKAERLEGKVGTGRRKIGGGILHEAVRASQLAQW